MPNKKCVVARCTHTSRRHKTLTFYCFPKDDKLQRKWIKAVSLRALLNYRWKPSDRICSAHFPNGRKLGKNNIPSIFPRWDFKKKQVVWPVDISSLLKENLYPVDNNDVFTSKSDIENKPIHGEDEVDRPSEINETNIFHISTENTTIVDESEDLRDEVECNSTGNKEKVSINDGDCPNCGTLRQRVQDLEKQRDIQRFGVKRFMLSDSDMRFYTGLPDYRTFLALYNFLKPQPGFQLNYYNNYTNKTASEHQVVRGRPRSLNSIDELFLTLIRLRLNLFEKDLGDRFNISQSTVSEIFSTWIDRMHDCLGQLKFTANPSMMKQYLPACFKSGHEDVSLIIDCTEIFLERPSQVIQQSATWSDYKSHNTGKALLALSPVMLPVFTSDIFPGSISDEEMVIECGVLQYAQNGDRWLADKGFLIQHILNKYGVRVDTPEKLEGMGQFNYQEDCKNRKNSQVRVHVERGIR
ncbi:uncharacterized protein LOC114518578 [Dendronephthya gigantea]|uniref:uncharacterized protein LOC114518578 n=1 Tax=Dendronephthya gigantea TaxID=151771 RepID=UPI00106DCA86|nr:uncharacterized protein LOC114518578 [Dendronephthya gigantea]